MSCAATCRSGSAAGDGRSAVQVHPEALCACAPPWPSAHNAAGCPASCPVSHYCQVGHCPVLICFPVTLTAKSCLHRLTDSPSLMQLHVREIRRRVWVVCVRSCTAEHPGKSLSHHHPSPPDDLILTPSPFKRLLARSQAGSTLLQGVERRAHRDHHSGPWAVHRGGLAV